MYYLTLRCPEKSQQDQGKCKIARKVCLLQWSFKFVHLYSTFSNFMYFTHPTHKPIRAMLNCDQFHVSHIQLIFVLNRHFIFWASRMGIYLTSCLEPMQSTSTALPHAKAGIPMPIRYLDLTCTSSSNCWYSFSCSKLGLGSCIHFFYYEIHYRQHLRNASIVYNVEFHLLINCFCLKCGK